jgi:hypothetical protein
MPSLTLKQEKVETFPINFLKGEKERKSKRGLSQIKFAKLQNIEKL